MVTPGSKNGAWPGWSSRGQISFLTEYGHIIYQIEGIDEAIALGLFLSKSDDYVIQDGSRKVTRSFFY